MNKYEPCLFSKFAVREEPAVDGGTIAPGEFVGCVLLEVDDHLMGGPGKAHHESMERLRQKIKFGKWHWLIQDGPSFFGGRHFTKLPDRSFKVDMTRFIQERLRPISFARGRCLDRSAEATEGEVKALRAVAGSLSWVARQCRPDEVGTASTLQGSVSRLTYAQCPFRMPHPTWTVQTARRREASWSALPRQNCTSKDQQSCHPCLGRRTR